MPRPSRFEHTNVLTIQGLFSARTKDVQSGLEKLGLSLSQGGGGIEGGVGAESRGPMLSFCVGTVPPRI
jgi:hypothetical protein